MHLVPQVVGLVLTLPVCVVLLRAVRGRKRRRLEERVGAGEILAGAPVNWLTTAGHPKWSGCLVILPGMSLRWEPDAASIRRGAAPMTWPLALVRLDEIKTALGFTGESYRIVVVEFPHDLANPLPPAMGNRLVLFRPSGPWRELLDEDV